MKFTDFQNKANLAKAKEITEETLTEAEDWVLGFDFEVEYTSREGRDIQKHLQKKFKKTYSGSGSGGSGFDISFDGDKRELEKVKKYVEKEFGPVLNKKYTNFYQYEGFEAREIESVETATFDLTETSAVYEATKWKMGDGRPRGGARIENVRFWDLSKDELEYIIKDAGEAMRANPKARKATTGPGNWADQVNDASTVLAWRKKNGIKESVQIDEDEKTQRFFKGVHAELKKVMDNKYYREFQSSNDGRALDNVINHFGKSRGFRVDKTVKSIIDKYGRNRDEYVKKSFEMAAKARIGEEVELEEAMSGDKLLGIFNKLKNKDTVEIKFDSGIRKGRDYQKFVVTSGKRTVGKARVERIILKSVDNLRGVAYTLYNRKGNVTLAQGDMGVSIVDIKESVELDEAKKYVPSRRELKQFSDNIEDWSDMEMSGTDDKDDKREIKQQEMELRKVASALSKGDLKKAFKMWSNMDSSMQDTAPDSIFKKLDAMYESVELDEVLSDREMERFTKAHTALHTRYHKQALQIIKFIDSVAKHKDKWTDSFGDYVTTKLPKQLKISNPAGVEYQQGRGRGDWSFLIQNDMVRYNNRNMPWMPKSGELKFDKFMKLLDTWKSETLKESVSIDEFELEEAKSPVKTLGKEAKSVLAMAINMANKDSGVEAHPNNLEYFTSDAISAAIEFLDKNSKKLNPAGRHAAREIAKKLGESVELEEKVVKGEAAPFVVKQRDGNYITSTQGKKIKYVGLELSKAKRFTKKDAEYFASRDRGSKVIELDESVRTAFKGADKNTKEFQHKIKSFGFAKSYNKTMRDFKKHAESGDGVFFIEEIPSDEETKRTKIGSSMKLEVLPVEGNYYNLKKLGDSDEQKRGGTVYKVQLIAMKEDIDNPEYEPELSQMNIGEGKAWDAILRIKDQMTAEKVHGMLVDMQTAKLLCDVMYALNKGNQKKFMSAIDKNAAGLKKMVDFAWKQVK